MTSARITKSIEFDAGHRIPLHTSKCKNLHGHRYKVEVTCQGSIIERECPSQGMLIDFGELKNMMTKLIHDPLDHGFIMFKDDLELDQVFFGGQLASDPELSNHGKVIIFPYVPTAENIARWCYEQLAEPIADYFTGDLRLYKVVVWETPTSSAVYRGGR